MTARKPKIIGASSWEGRSMEIYLFLAANPWAFCLAVIITTVICAAKG
jgi:multidrug efflux pump subunit AcrB